MEQSTSAKVSVRPRATGSVASEGRSGRMTVISRDNSEMNLLRAEIAELKAARRLESVSASRVMEELAANETVQYIRYLESEQERLHNQIKDISTQLHASKVANQALARS